MLGFGKVNLCLRLTRLEFDTLDKIAKIFSRSLRAGVNFILLLFNPFGFNSGLDSLIPPGDFHLYLIFILYLRGVSLSS